MALLLFTWAAGLAAQATSSVHPPSPQTSTSTQAPAQTPGQTPASMPSTLQLRRDADVGPVPGASLSAFRAFAVVLLLMAVTYWALRQIQKAQGRTKSGAPWRKWLGSSVPGEGVTIIQSIRLTPKASIHLLCWDGKEWMVGLTDQGITMLGQRSLTAPSPPPSSEVIP